MKLIFIFQIISYLPACAHNVAYRTNTEEICSHHDITKIDSVCAKNSIQEVMDKTKNKKYSLSFVEFDDQGQFHDRRQLDSLLQKLGKLDNPIIVVFIHGWQNNAAPGNENVKEFRNILGRVANFNSDYHLPQREVVGVYLGWRGLSVSAPMIKKATFWGRKEAARKVGEGGVT